MSSPIDLGFPWVFKNFILTYKFTSIINLEMTKIDKNIFKIKEIFGELFYDNQSYQINEIYFKYPSEHLINNIRYSMEMQIIANDQNQNQIQLIQLFEQNNVYSNPELYKLGFGSKKLNELKLSSNQYQYTHIIKNVFTLNNYQKDQNDFLLYQGNSTIDCQQNLIFVNKNIHWIGKEQLKEFDLYLKSKYKIINRNKIFLFQNFLKPEDTYYQNVRQQKITDTIIPSEIDKEYFMFEPYSLHQPLGYFPDISTQKNRIPIWDPLAIYLKKKVLENNFKREGPFKFIPIAFDQLNDQEGQETEYIPIYILVPNDFLLSYDKTPKSIPMLLRTQYTIFDGIRPNILIDVPIYYDKQQQQKQQPEEENFEEQFIKICKQWMLSVVLNRNLKQEQIFKDVKKLIGNEIKIQKCKKNLIVPKKNLNNLEVDSNVVDPFQQKDSQICELRLEIILNRNFNQQISDDQNFADYVSRKCKNMSILSGIATQDQTNPQQTLINNE